MPLYNDAGQLPYANSNIGSVKGSRVSPATRGANAYIIELSNYGFKMDGVTDEGQKLNDLMSGIASRNAQSGKTCIIRGAGTLGTTVPIDNKFPGITLVGQTGRLGPHDSGAGAGAPVYGFTISALAGFIGSHICKLRTPYAAEQGIPVGNVSSYDGGGFEGIRIVGNEINTGAFLLDSRRGWNIQIYYTGTTGSGFTAICGISGTNIGEAADNQRATTVLAFRYIDTTAQRLVTPVVIGGNTNANTSIIQMWEIYGQTYQQTAIDIVAADNMTFFIAVSSPVAYSVPAIICRSNKGGVNAGANNILFDQYSAPGAIKFEGTETAGTITAAYGFIRNLDDGNGTPYPIIGTGARCPILTDTKSISHELSIRSLVASDSRVGAEKARIYARANPGAALYALSANFQYYAINGDATAAAVYGQAPGIGGDFQFVRTIGTGGFSFNGNLQWSLNSGSNPSAISDFKILRLSNTQIALRMIGTDSVLRSVTLTLT